MGQNGSQLLKNQLKTQRKETVVEMSKLGTKISKNVLKFVKSKFNLTIDATTVAKSCKTDAKTVKLQSKILIKR